MTVSRLSTCASSKAALMSSAAALLAVAVAGAPEPAFAQTKCELVDVGDGEVALLVDVQDALVLADHREVVEELVA